MNVGFSTGQDRLLVFWPLIIEHRIDSESPLWSLNPTSLARADFELLVVFEGIIESTGLLTQARASYVPQDIVWGARFEPIVHYDPFSVLTIDYSKFNSIVSDNDTQKFSANQLNARYNYY